ncbi:MAG: hypothetical protein HQK60_03890 [Deltaproteobacteria bacterium]|nr:hypothetical protein [Deltaproteobacteria bacterium]
MKSHKNVTITRVFVTKGQGRRTGKNLDQTMKIIFPLNKPETDPSGNPPMTVGGSILGVALPQFILSAAGN